VIAKAIVGIMKIPQPWVLSLDRTNWSFGQIHFNILMLTIVHQGIGFPLVWLMLDKKGNSHSVERMDLLDKFREIFPDAQVSYIAADREFIGKEWLSYLLIEPIVSFRIRIRHSDKISEGKKVFSAGVIFANLLPGQTQVLANRRWVWGRLVYVAGSRLEDGSLLVVISDDAPETMIIDYARRWGIETLFGIFKTRGFCLESTHFTDAERLSKLLALMALALCWAMRTGEWLHQHNPIPLKKHGRLAKSIFRYGLDHLRSIFLDFDLNYYRFLHSLEFLSCT
jgi:hypothetical protein